MQHCPPMPATPELRDYQIDGDNQINDLIALGYRRILCCMPTGAGKTTLFSHRIQRAAAAQKTALVVAHRKELIDQAHTRLFLFGISAGMIAGGKKHRFKGDRVNVASIQTLARREMPPASEVAVDEAHHTTAKNQYSKLLTEYPDAVLIGFTATPERLDGKPLADFWEVLVDVITVAELIAQGHLVQPRYFHAPHSIDTKGVGKVAGDFNAAKLFERADKPQLYLGVFQNWHRLARTRKTVIFCVNVQHSIRTAEEFNSHGVSAAHLDAETPEAERRAILANFAAGRVQVVCNVGILTEGYDLPSIGCVVLNRATASLSLYMQMGGRGLRPDKPTHKTECLILDHGDNIKRHGFLEDPREWTLNVRKKKPGVAPIKFCKFEIPEHLADFAGDECGAINRAAATHCCECGNPFPVKKTEAKTVKLVEVLPSHLKGKRWHELNVKEIWEYQQAARTPKGERYKIGWALIQLRGFIARTGADPEEVFNEYADAAGYKQAWVYRQMLDYKQAA